MGEFRPLDLAVVAAYFAVLLYLGQRASRRVRNEEGFYLASRRLTKPFQFFLNFGNSTDANTAVSTVSLVYREGIAGVWLAFHMVFLNPYYWFMSVWFRRARLITMADLFEDRLGSPGLARLYALFQIGVGIVMIGFGNFTAFKISVAFAPQLPPLLFYGLFSGAIGLYLAMGGMAATAVNEAFQGVLIVAFSVLLIPSGLAHTGGWNGLREKVGPAMLNLFGSTGRQQFTWFSVLAALFVSAIQINANLGNMQMHGAGRNEITTRFGSVAGTYGKRIMILLWGVVGLIALALYQGPGQLGDPDRAWGLLSQRFFGPGFLGLMLAGTFAATTSTIAVKTLAVSALFVRNIFPPASGEVPGVLAGRIGVAAVLAAAVAAAMAMSDVVEVMKFTLTINLSLGAAVLLIFFWRRLTTPAVWWCVSLSLILLVALPYGLKEHGRYNVEAWLVARAVPSFAHSSPAARLAARFLIDGIFPFLVLIGVSLVTRPPDPVRVDRFFGRMKTPVGATPEAETAALAETDRNPRRFEATKLFPGSAWEFTQWDRTDTIGFVACCCVTTAIVGLFWMVLRI